MQPVTQMFFARQGTVTPAMRASQNARSSTRRWSARRSPEAGWSFRPTSTTSPAPRADGHRHGGEGQDQRQHRQLGRRVGRRAGAREAPSAVHYGADTVMDLSTGGEIDEIRGRSSRPPRPDRHRPDLPGGHGRGGRRRASPQMTARQHRAPGTAGRGLRHRPLRRAARVRRRWRCGRVTGIVSRGGSLHGAVDDRTTTSRTRSTRTSTRSSRSRAYDVTLSLGDGLRPGSLADASDARAVRRTRDPRRADRARLGQDVQVMIEGPGHIPMHQIEMNVRKEQEICHEAPFYTLGPLVTDIAPGYDHITSAIGAAMIGWYGAVDALLRHAEGAPRPAERRRRARGGDRLQDRRPRRRHRPRPHGRPGPRRRAQPRALRVRLEGAVPALARPRARARMHDETLPAEYFKSAEFCSMCGPKFCSMHLTREIVKKLGDEGRGTGEGSSTAPTREAVPAD